VTRLSVWFYIVYPKQDNRFYPV